MHRVAAGELRKPSGSRLINARRNETIGDRVGGEELEEWAFLNDTRVVVAAVDSLLEYIDIPSVDEVTVVSESSGIAVGQEEWLLVVVPQILEIIDRERDFIEERDEADWMGRWA